MASQQMQLGDWLDDLCVRFLINLPPGDLSSVERICFNAEEAHWYYEDFVRPTDASLPAMSLRTFCLAFFKHCPLLAQFSPAEHVTAFEQFILYKQRVPVRGVILLNPEMDSTILVKGWKKGSSWSFPRGKIAKDEPDVVCAIREAWEETGLDVRAAGLVPEGAEPKSIDITMKDSEIRLFIFRDVPMNTHFEPQTRKEISKIQWFKLSELPSFKKKGAQNKNQQADAAPNVNKFFMVAPFVNPLKRWIATQKKIDAKYSAGTNNMYLNPGVPADEDTVDSDYYAQQQPLASEYLQHPYNAQAQAQYAQPPAASGDKASALLSMLQPKAPTAPAPMPQPQHQGFPHQHLPHTPQELTTGEPPQPRNPHHHTNQQHPSMLGNQPPPPFHVDRQAQHAQQFPHGQPPPYKYYEHPPQHRNFGQKENSPRYQQDVRQVQANQAPLVHPQPLPPQVQRAVFNQSAFQEKSPSMPDAQIPQQQVPHGQPQQGQRQPSSGRPVQLNGQSMALLNAFKNNTGPSPSAQAAQPLQQQAQLQQPPAPNRPIYDAPAPAPQHIPQPPAQGKASSQYAHYSQQPPSQISELSASGQVSELSQKQSQRPSFSGPGPTDQQRSALLDMFKSKPSAAQAPKVPTPGSQASGRGSGMEQQLLDTLRRAPAEATPPKPAPQPASQPKAQPTGSLADLLAYRPRPDQNEAPKPQPQPPQDSVPPVHRLPSASSNPAAPQPIRILQRGQGLDALATQQPSHTSSQHSPYSNHSVPRTGSYASPPMATSQPSPGTSSQQPQATSDQKNKLLSLFGKQQQSKPAGTSASPSVAEAGSGRGTPGRPGSSAPMSPAEQTFLLDYLQSVTNGAKR